MSVRCSEISINITVKHMHHVGVILTLSLTWADLLSFQVFEETEKVAWFWFARNISTQVNTIVRATMTERSYKNNKMKCNLFEQFVILNIEL